MPGVAHTSSELWRWQKAHVVDDINSQHIQWPLSKPRPKGLTWTITKNRWAVKRRSQTIRPDPDHLMLLERIRNADTYLQFLSPRINSVTAGLAAKADVDAHPAFTTGGTAISLLSEGLKWSPLIASSSHSKFIYPCCITTQHSHVQLTAKKRASPLRTEVLRVTQVSPTEWITKLWTETCIIFLSQTADRLEQWVLWQKANLTSLILWDELKPWVTVRKWGGGKTPESSFRLCFTYGDMKSPPKRQITHHFRAEPINDKSISCQLLN